MGETVCRALERAEDMELAGRADPALGASVTDALAAGPDVLVDFTTPSTAVSNAREAVEAGVHVVIGTTGFDIDQLRGLSARMNSSPRFLGAPRQRGLWKVQNRLRDAARALQLLGR